MKKVIFVLIASSIFLLIFIYKKFEIKKLIIVSYKPKIRGVSIFEGNNLLLVNEKKISNYLSEQNTDIKSIVLGKEFPQTITLRIESRTPIAAIGDETKNLYIDSEGIILTEESNIISLPKIQAFDFEIYKDGKADWRITKASSFIDMVGKQGILIDQILVDNSSSSFKMKTNDGIEILLPFDTDIATKASSLQIILARFKIVGKNITRIDFRFDKPLVTLANGEKISSTF